MSKILPLLFIHGLPFGKLSIFIALPRSVAEVLKKYFSKTESKLRLHGFRKFFIGAVARARHKWCRFLLPQFAFRQTVNIYCTPSLCCGSAEKIFFGI